MITISQRLNYFTFRFIRGDLVQVTVAASLNLKSLTHLHKDSNIFRNNISLNLAKPSGYSDLVWDRSTLFGL